MSTEYRFGHETATEGEVMDSAPKSPTGVMNIMDETGHRQLSWNLSNAKEIAAAQKTFDRLVHRGHTAFGAHNKADLKQAITAFDPTMEEVVMVPRIVGG
jgi:hypothetical protein